MKLISRATPRARVLQFLTTPLGEQLPREVQASLVELPAKLPLAHLGLRPGHDEELFALGMALKQVNELGRLREQRERAKRCWTLPTEASQEPVELPRHFPVEPIELPESTPDDSTEPRFSTLREKWAERREEWAVQRLKRAEDRSKRGEALVACTKMLVVDEVELVLHPTDRKAWKEWVTSFTLLHEAIHAALSESATP